MRVIGLMSGTSFDGIEAAAADLRIDGEILTMTTIGHTTMPYPNDVRTAIAKALPPSGTTARAIAQIDTLVGQAFAEAASQVDDTLCDNSADLVVSHGQTLYHWVEDGEVRGSLQLGQPAWIAERTGLPVVADLRAADIAAGGHGAPLVSMFDVLLIGKGAGTRAALNLGGIANLTVIRPDSVPFAYDTGPGNALIDAAVSYYSDDDRHYDEDGRWAAEGRVDERLFERLMNDPYYDAEPPKTTGKERFNLGYLLDALPTDRDLQAADVIATLTQLTAETVAKECQRHDVGTVIASGGGTKNSALMDAMSSALGDIDQQSIDAYGVPSVSKEAYAFAVLGYLTVLGVPGTITSCTGARTPSLLGSITPGRTPFAPPPPAAAPPTRLRVQP